VVDNIFEAILRAHGGDRVASAAVVARGLMGGDPATCKAGYSLPNAVIAAGELYELTAEQRDGVREQLETMAHSHKCRGCHRDVPCQGDGETCFDGDCDDCKAELARETAPPCAPYRMAGRRRPTNRDGS
jgi:hypothetical protein